MARLPTLALLAYLNVLVRLGPLVAARKLEAALDFFALPIRFAI